MIEQPGPRLTFRNCTEAFVAYAKMVAFQPFMRFPDLSLPHSGWLCSGVCPTQVP